MTDDSRQTIPTIAYITLWIENVGHASNARIAINNALIVWTLVRHNDD